MARTAGGTEDGVRPTNPSPAWAGGGVVGLTGTSSGWGFRYDGTFPLAILRDGEFVRATGDGSGDCEIVFPDGSIRTVHVGDWVGVGL